MPKYYKAIIKQKLNNEIVIFADRLLLVSNLLTINILLLAIIIINNTIINNNIITRPFDMQKLCTKLKVNKPCHWLAEFAYLLLSLEQGFYASKGLIAKTQDLQSERRRNNSRKAYKFVPPCSIFKMIIQNYSKYFNILYYTCIYIHF